MKNQLPNFQKDLRMSNIAKIRGRIKSINNTAKITHAMELVAAAKMKRAQNNALSAKPYSKLINEILGKILPDIETYNHPLLVGQESDKELVVVIAPDRGLAGPLVSNLVRELNKLNHSCQFVTIGKKAQDYVARSNRELVADFAFPEESFLSVTKPITKLVIDKFLQKEIGKVSVVYTEFESTLKQETKIIQLLPITNLENLNQTVSGNESQEFQFEPKVDQILDALLPHYLIWELEHYLLESRASEHSSRMLAMKNATENADDLVADLKLAYNQLRQDVITSEILDITTSQNTLN